MRKKIPEIWAVIIDGKIQLNSVGVGRNFATRRHLRKKHSVAEWKRVYARGARLIRLHVEPYSLQDWKTIEKQELTK